MRIFSILLLIFLPTFTASRPVFAKTKNVQKEKSPVRGCFFSSQGEMEKKSGEIGALLSGFLKTLYRANPVSAYLFQGKIQTRPFHWTSTSKPDQPLFTCFSIQQPQTDLLSMDEAGFRKLFFPNPLTPGFSFKKVKCGIFYLTRNKAHGGYSVKFRFDTRIYLANGGRYHDYGEWYALVRETAGKLKISTLVPYFHDRSTAKRPLFTEQYLQHSWALPPITAARIQNDINDRFAISPGGLCLLDFNGDHYPDIFFSPGFNRSFFYQNEKNGYFIDKTRDLNLEGSRSGNGMSSLFIDFDGDGDLDMVNALVNRSLENDKGFLTLYENREGRFHYRPKAIPIEHFPALNRAKSELYLYSSLTAVDINGDGLTDIFACGYINSSLSDQFFNRVDSRDGVPSTLFINKGNLTFVDEGKKRGLQSLKQSLVVLFYDFDGDGDLDFYEGVDYSPDNVYENDGKGFFKMNRSLAIGSERVRGSMGVSVGDITGNGRLDFYISGMDSKAGRRLAAINPGLPDEIKKNMKSFYSGSTLYTETKDSRFTNRKGNILFARQFGINTAGWAWGSALGDIDLDGKQEIFVTNGYTSHSREKKKDY